MSLLMSGEYRGDTELNKRAENENARAGSCLLALRDPEVVQWVATKRYFLDQLVKSPQLSSNDSKGKQNREGAVPGKDLALLETQKRKKITPNEIIVVGKCAGNRDNLSSKKKKIKHVASEVHKKEKSIACKKENFINRWSVERYKQAEKNMLEVMKSLNAVFERPISRPVLRSGARNLIGDTGLLDHLLKHIDGRLAPGGTERFRRCYNTEGVMEYWLESPDLVKVKRETGLLDPSWIPPRGFALQDSTCAGELTLLKEELANIKSDMELLTSDSHDHDPVKSVKDSQGLSKWRRATDGRLMEIPSTLSGMQEMHKEMATWKSKIEQQVKEALMSLNSMLPSKSCTTLSLASEKWEDWFDGTNLNNIREEDFTCLLESTDFSNIGQDALVKDMCTVSQSSLKPSSTSTHETVCARELNILKEEMRGIKRDVEMLVTKNMDVDQATFSPDSSATYNSRFTFDNSFPFQEMFKEFMSWKAEMEQQVMEVSNSVNALLASKQQKLGNSP